MDFVKHTPWLMPLVLFVAVGTVSVLRPAVGQGPSEGVPSAKDQKAGDKKGAPSDVAVSPTTKQNGPEAAADKAECKGCTEHDKADLYEQRRMAKAAESQNAINIFNGVLVFLSVVFMAVAAGAAVIAGRAAQRSANVAERALIDLERPHVFLEVKTPGLRYNSHTQRLDLAGQFRYSFVNHGRTPAQLLDIVLRYPRLGHPFMPPAIADDLAADRIFPVGVITSPDEPYSEPENLMSREAYGLNGLADDPRTTFFFFMGRVRYEDIFRQSTYVTGFCFVFDTLGQKFVRRGGHTLNYTKKE